MLPQKYLDSANRERWQRMEDIFHAALEHEPEERRAFLGQACGEDSSLLRDLERLLATEQEAGSFLENPVIDEITAPLPGSGSLLGRQIGPYRIVSHLGAGGMGEVYLAHDHKLGRDVAIKTLPCAFARDPDRLDRFRREARILASLNHPNIGAIYGLEQSDDFDCLVLELVEGEALRGPLPIGTALDYALQIADALQVAHDKGLIHRDLKPANVKVTPEGRVKVLDFGLAKALVRTGHNPELSPAAVATPIQTLAGQVAGTPGYMSPEQSRGEEVDKRADTWAFGCLFYELLTGERAFPGKTIPDILAAISEREPDWQALPANTPAVVRELLRQCLQKDANRRPQTIAEARNRIKQAQGGRNAWRVATIAALATIALAAALWLSRPSHPSGSSDWTQLTRFPDPVGQPALSADGRMLAFVRGPRTDYGLGQVYVKQLPAGEPVELTHDSLKKVGPAFSPEGAHIAYTAVNPQFNWDTWIVPVNGGTPQPFQINASGLTWFGRQLLFSEIKVNHPMTLVATQHDRTGPHNVYVPSNFRGMARRSYASPDGKWVLLVEMGPYGGWEPCRVVPMDGNSPGRRVGPPGSPCTFGAWSRDGKWIYLSSKAGGLYHIWRQRFPSGQPEQFTAGITEEEGIAMAPDGRSLITAVALESSSLWIHDGRGERQVSVLEGNAAHPKFAPDGKRLFYRIVKAVPPFGTSRDPGDLWVADLESGRSEPVAPGFKPLEYDISRDGRSVVMEVADPAGKPRLWLAPLDGHAMPRQISDFEGEKPVFGPEGDIFFRRVEFLSSSVYRTRPDGTGLRKALEQTVFYAGNISPDGQAMSTWGRLPGDVRGATQLIPLKKGSPIVIGGNTMLQWSFSGDSLWLSAGAVPDGRTYIVPLSKGTVLPPIPKGGFHSEEDVANLPGARRLDAEGAPGPSLGIYAFQRRTVQRNLYQIPIP